MSEQIGNKAFVQNPALKPFEILIGEWETTGSHPYLPDAQLKGRAVFEWYANGAFIVLRSEVDHPEIPDGLEIFASDDAAKAFFMLHFDQRGTSRKFDVTVDDDQFMWQRDNPDFSQRCTIQVLDDGDRLESKGEMSKDGGEWEGDLSLTYKRVR